VITGLNVDYDFGPVTASVIGGFADLHQSYLVDRAYTTDTRGILYTMYNSTLGPLAGAPPVGTQYLKVFQGSGPDPTRDMTWNSASRRTPSSASVGCSAHPTTSTTWPARPSS
jgi:hypothetical protein